jgi:hypothetical protein
VGSNLVLLDRQPPRVVDPLQQDPVAVEVLVDGLSGASVVPVVVDEQDAAGGQPRVEVHELVARRLVPVGIKAKQRHGVGRVLGQRLLDGPLDEPDPGGVVAAGCEQRKDFLARGARLSLRVRGEDAGCYV